MNIGVVKFSIRIPGNQSLKGKRRIVNSLCQKLRNQFSLSVAEVESHEDHKHAVIGVSLVSNNSQILQQVISQLLSFLQTHSGDYVLLDFKQEIIAGI